MYCETAEKIELSKLNESMRGLTVTRVMPLYDIYDDGKQSGFALAVRLPGEKRAKPGRCAPFWFTDKAEANKAKNILNDWSNGA